MSYTRRQLLHQATEKERLAAAFEKYAKSLEEVFADIPTTPEASAGIWIGPAAERYTGRAHRMKGDLKELREDCTATAARLRERASRLREEAARVPDS